MLIHRMAAVFGKLQGQSLELQDGLNIIHAPNEAGKSTWCAFLLSMLYGINSRERDRTGFIADKNRYAPWSGAAMSGRLDCSTEIGELTLTRTTRRQSSPMGDFSAVYAGTGDPVPHLSGINCGETLLGVSREVFERSAFIRQSGLAISQDSGLERRISAFITSGEETVSYTEASESLKKQLNRRRHHKTGQLPALEAELAELERQLAGVSLLEQQLLEARTQAESLAAQEAALKEELLHHDRWDAAQQRQALKAAQDAAAQAEAKAAALRRSLEEERIPENDAIARLRGAIVNLGTVRKSVDRARAERDEAMKALLWAESAVNESPFAGQTAEGAKEAAAALPNISSARWAGIAVFFLFLFAGSVSAMLLFSACSPLGGWIQILPWALFLSVTAVGCYISRLVQRNKTRQLLAAYRLKHFGAASENELAALLDTYIGLLKTRDAAQAAASAKSSTFDALYASLSSNEQGILLEVRRFAPTAFDILTADSMLRSCAVRRKELAEAEAAAQEARMRCEIQAQQLPAVSSETVSPPGRSREAVSTQLEQVQRALASVRSAADRLSGQLQEAGDPVVLRSAASSLSLQQAALEKEYHAIRLAIDALDSANTTLQSRFSPALGRRAAEIFAQLTGQRYTGVVLDRDFHLYAEPKGDSIFRDAALLSAGTLDQLYLAVRLAISDLVLPTEQRIPIILDDALANFDDNRCAAALRWLKEASASRQILLFTCHTREAEFFSGDQEVAIQQLTNPNAQV